MYVTRCAECTCDCDIFIRLKASYYVSSPIYRFSMLSLLLFICCLKVITRALKVSICGGNSPNQ